MVLAPVQMPIFTMGTPAFANEAAIRSHRLTEIDVTPVVYERRTPEWYDGATHEDPVHEVLMFFDPDEYPVAEYGLIFGDRAFEDEAARQISKIFPRKRFGEVEYTSLNEQGDDFVSMRFPIGNGRGFSRELRKDVNFFSGLDQNELLSERCIINALTAERYRQAVEPRRPEGARPAPPKGLYAGMWITWIPTG